VISADVPLLGPDLGYRGAIHEDIFAHRADIDWLEIITDQFLPLTAERRAELDLLSSSFACVPHGLELSIGSSGLLDEQYLSQICAVADAVSAPWISQIRRQAPVALSRGGRKGCPVQAWRLGPVAFEVLSQCQGNMAVRDTAARVGSPTASTQRAHEGTVEVIRQALLTGIMGIADAATTMDAPR
jgi:hypothetical protein